MILIGIFPPLKKKVGFKLEVFLAIFDTFFREGFDGWFP